MNTKRIISMLCTILSIIFVFWVIASWVDVVSNNLNENPTYYFWNFFQILINSK